MRPSSVERAELCMLVSLGLGAVNIGLAKAADPASYPGSDVFFVLVIGGALIVFLGLVLLATRKRSNIARWVLTASAALSIPQLIQTISETVDLEPLSAALTVVVYALNFSGVWLLFRPDSAAWFRKKKGDVTAPPPAAA